MSNLQHTLQRRGFAPIALGGNCTGWAAESADTRIARGGYFWGARGAATVVITSAGEPIAPQSLRESVAVVVYDKFGAESERVVFEDTFPSLAYALRCMRLDA
jgi:hypothetical protein